MHFFLFFLGKAKKKTLGKFSIFKKSAQFFRYLWFVHSLGVRSPCLSLVSWLTQMPFYGRIDSMKEFWWSSFGKGNEFNYILLTGKPLNNFEFIFVYLSPLKIAKEIMVPLKFDSLDGTTNSKTVWLSFHNFKQIKGQ